MGDFYQPALRLDDLHKMVQSNEVELQDRDAIEEKIEADEAMHHPVQVPKSARKPGRQEIEKRRKLSTWLNKCNKQGEDDLMRERKGELDFFQGKIRYLGKRCGEFEASCGREKDQAKLAALRGLLLEARDKLANATKELEMLRGRLAREDNLKQSARLR